MSAFPAIIARGRRLISAVLLAALFTASTAVLAETVELRSVPFSGGLENSGGLRFAGGLILQSPARAFGGLSGLQVVDQGARLIAVSDEGNFFVASVVRDQTGNPEALSSLEQFCLCRRDGSRYGSKRWSDAEGLFLEGNTAFVSFERLHRINRYQLDGDFRPGPPAQATISLKGLGLDSNKGLETVARLPDGPNSGRLLAIAEESRNSAGHHRAFILDTTSIGEFSIEEKDGYSITGADFLPSGDLLILQRKFSYLTGLFIRVLRIKQVEIAPGSTAAPELLAEFSGVSGIDNMEGLSVWQDPQSQTRVSLISDDNFSELQKTLYLEFILQE